MTKVAINGFGRIGRTAFKIAFDKPELEVVAINDLTDTKTLAYLLKHDSNYGTYEKEVSFDETNLIVDGKKIPVVAIKEPAELPWSQYGVEVVIESTGRFTDPESAGGHLKAGAKRVVISAPAKDKSGKGSVDGVSTIVLGVNDKNLDEAEHIMSNASCTTNNIAPVASVILKKFGIKKSLMTTVHSYTASQALQDAPAKDLREGRNAAENIVPTTTGAAIAAAIAIPELQGNFDGISIRVPTPVVSISDMVFHVERETTVEEVNAALKDAADNDPALKGILGYTDEPLVSSDFIGDPRSAVVDLALTKVVGGDLVKVMAWYDNEFGYSNRLVEQVIEVGRRIK